MQPKAALPPSINKEMKKKQQGWTAAKQEKKDVADHSIPNHPKSVSKSYCNIGQERSMKEGWMTSQPQHKEEQYLSAHNQ